MQQIQVQSKSSNALHSRALTCVKPMAVWQDESHVGFTIFVKHLESVGGLYENHKAHTKIGQFFSLYNEVIEYT
jgi:hypothetical protein